MPLIANKSNLIFALLAMNKRPIKIGHLIPAIIFTLLSIAMCVEDVRFSYDLLLNDHSEFWWFYAAFFIWAGVSVFTPYISKWHVVIFLTLLSFRSIFGWPLNVFGSNNAPVIFFDILLILASVAYIAYALGFLGNNERSAKFNAKHFGISILNLHLIPAVFMVLGFFGISQAVSNFSGGHIKLTAQGMEMQNLVMENPEGKQAHLIGMVHMGDSQYYKQVKEGFKQNPSSKKLVLHEGVSDKEGLMKSAIDYSFIASLLGLETQNKEWSKLDKPKGKQGSPSPKLEIDQLNADIDLSELPEEGLALLNEIFSMMSAPDLQTMIENMNAVKITDADMAEFMEKSLIKFRNDHLMEIFNDNLENYDEIYLPWGAAHLKELESQLRKQNFTEVSKSYYTAFCWADILKRITAQK